MREVLGALFLFLMILSSCAQGGYQPTYIISEHAEEKAPPPEKEEAF